MKHKDVGNRQISDEKRAQTQTSSLENLTPEQMNRYWEHHLHADEVLYNRPSFFLVFESVLLGVVGVSSSKSSLGKFMLVTLICLGVALTLIWGYALARQKFVLNKSKERLQKVLPEYQEIVKDRELGKWPFSSVTLITYSVPLLIGCVWSVLLIYTLLT